MSSEFFAGAWNVSTILIPIVVAGWVRSLPPESFRRLGRPVFWVLVAGLVLAIELAWVNAWFVQPMASRALEIRNRKGASTNDCWHAVASYSEGNWWNSVGWQQVGSCLIALLFVGWLLRQHPRPPDYDHPESN